MSDESTVKTTLLPSGTILPEVAVALTDVPDSHLRTSDDGAEIARDPPTASPSAARIASSRTSSAEATDVTTLYTSSSSSSPPPSSDPSSSSMTPAPAVVPPWSLTRIPARLRRKCPLFVEQSRYQCRREEHGDDEDEDVAAKNVDMIVKCESTSEEEDGALPILSSPVPGLVATSTQPPKNTRTVRRPRVPPPVPVPHLIKKSRGRRVPEPTEARERAHVCAVPGCSKSFARAEHLKRHVLSLHTHEKRMYPFYSTIPPCPRD